MQYGRCSHWPAARSGRFRRRSSPAPPSGCCARVQPDCTRLPPTATRLLSAANEPREVVSRPDHVGLFDGVAHGDAFVQFAREIGVGEINGVELTDGDSLPAVFANADAHPATKAVLRHLESEGRRRRTPRPVDLDVLRDALVNAFDPHRDPVASVRVRATISPDDGTTAPREPCPLDLYLPAWRYLRDHHREWLFPGAHTMTDGEVVGVASNPVFVDAFLLGLNTQALAELRWRNLPIASGCTPLRRFWGPARQPRWRGRRAHRHPGRAPMGRPCRGHRRPVAAARARDTRARRGSTSACPRLLPHRSVPPIPGHRGVPGAPDGGSELGRRRHVGRRPRCSDVQRADHPAYLALYAFPVAPESLRDVWVVVEQQSPGFRFARSDDRAGTAAERAAAMLVQPVRVLLAGTTLVGGE